LWKHFHALRPLKIALASPSRAVHDVFHRIYHKLACRLLPVDTPTRLRKTGDPADPDLVRLSRAIGQAQADLGVLVEDDGEQCTVLDEQGRIVAPQVIALILCNVASVILTDESVAVFPAAWQGRQIEPTDVQSSSRDAVRDQQALQYVSDPRRENMTRAMRRQRAAFGADGMGRYWFAESYPACDAMLTIVHLLQALSHSDATLSRVVQNFGG
jgi:phosphomannomutase